jgi:hypothetical protein
MIYVQYMYNIFIVTYSPGDDRDGPRPNSAGQQYHRHKDGASPGGKLRD